MSKNPAAIAATPSTKSGRYDETLAGLRREIRRLEGAALPDTGRDSRGGGDLLATFGWEALDRALPWGGLPATGCHQILDADGTGSGFAAALLGRFAAKGQAVLWCTSERGLYAPGLVPFGLRADNLIVVRASSRHDRLWALEEALAARCLGAALGEFSSDDLTPTTARRLQLAAEAGKTAALLLTPAPQTQELSPLPALTRWGVRAAEAPAGADLPPEQPLWRAELLRCRGGMTGGPNGAERPPTHWTLSWDFDRHCFQALDLQTPDLQTPEREPRHATPDRRTLARDLLSRTA